MKKTFRVTLLILAVISAALLFTGCSSMDELRAHRINWTDKKHEAIELGDKTYKKLPSNDYFYVDTFDLDYFIADEDVPLLLASQNILGDTIYSTKDGSILSIYGEYYVTDSEYESYLDLIKNAKLDKYCYLVDKFDENGDYYSETVILDDKTCKLINEALEKKVEAEPSEDKDYYFDAITRCDSTGMMRDDSVYFCIYDEVEGIYVEEGRKTYRLPDEYYDMLKNQTFLGKGRDFAFETECPVEVVFD